MFKNFRSFLCLTVLNPHTSDTNIINTTSIKIYPTFDNDNNDWKIKNIGELPLIITDYVANGSFASLKENVTILDYEEYAYFIRNTDLKSKSFQKFVNKHSYDFLKKSSLLF